MAAATHIAAAAAVAPSTKEGRHVPKEARYIRAPLQLSQIVEEAHEVLDTQHKAERDTERQRPVRVRAYEPASRV